MRRPAGRRARSGDAGEANVRTRVHEYGGGAWCLAGAEVVVFVDFADQRLYRQRLGEEPVAISPEPAEPGGRCAMPTCASTPDGEAIVCVREVHGEGEAGEPDRRSAARRRGRAAGAGRRSRLLLVPAGQPRRRGGWPGPAGTTRTCPGTGPSCGSRRCGDSGEERLVAGGAEESVFQPEWDAGRAPALRLRPRRLVEPLPRLERRERGRARTLHRPRRPTSPIPSGSSAAPPTPSSRAARSPACAASGAEERLFAAGARR